MQPRLLRIGAGTHRMGAAYMLALLLGALPLVLGVSIFFAWWATDARWLIDAGFVTLYGGIASVSIGAVALAYSCRRGWREPAAHRRAICLPALACAALLLSNFPVAVGVVLAASVIESRHVVTVHNATEERLDDVRIVGGGCDVLLGPIPPGGSARAAMWFQHDDSLRLRTRSATSEHETDLDVYVCRGLGGRTSVVVHADGKAEAKQSAGRTKL